MSEKSPAQRLTEKVQAAFGDDLHPMDELKADLFFQKIESLAGHGLSTSHFTQSEIKTLCASILEHVKAYREKIGIFRGLRTD